MSKIGYKILASSEMEPEYLDKFVRSPHYLKRWKKDLYSAAEHLGALGELGKRGKKYERLANEAVHNRGGTYIILTYGSRPSKLSLRKRAKLARMYEESVVWAESFLRFPDMVFGKETI
jgi:hypothetical protein